MNSKVVNREIRSKIRPLLKERRFSRFTARNAWRYTDSRIEVLNFQSFNSYNAEVMGCTTYSFAVNLGSYSLELPDICVSGVVKEKEGQSLPQEYECHFRGRLNRSFVQPELGREYRDIWYIDPEGKYLDRAILDVQALIDREAIPWFEKLRSTEAVLQTLLRDPENDRLWGFGARPSPHRSLLTGYTALALGDLTLARAELRNALDSGCYDSIADRLAKDIEACRRSGS